MKRQPLKYKIIKSKSQYKSYCLALKYLLDQSATSQSNSDEIELLTFLIEKYDAEQSVLHSPDPIHFLRSFMVESNLKAKDLAELLGVSKGYVSEILNYKKSLSKEVIRKLSDRFKVRQDLFNRPYALKSKSSNHAQKLISS
jgi:HTH-type transcriptional regulator/antitoxin HigA